jgi:hypothetical protein
VEEKILQDLQRERVMTQGVDQQVAAQSVLPDVVESVLGSIGGKAFHNFEGDTMEVWRQISIATGPDVVPAAQVLDKPFRLKNFYCHQIQIAGKGPGEYKDAIRCVLIDVEGRAFAFVSDGVAGDLARIISTFGMGPYSDGIPMVVKAFQTGNKRRAYTIQPA